MVPDAQDIEVVNDVICKELCLDNILDSSLMRDRGALGVILGCTEIGMLISEKDSVLSVYDTTLIYAAEAARMQLGRA